MTHILHTSSVHKAVHKLTSVILHIASLAAHTTLNTYKPMEISIERSTQYWCPSECSNSEFFAQENDALTVRPQPAFLILESTSSTFIILPR